MADIAGSVIIFVGIFYQQVGFVVEHFLFEQLPGGRIEGQESIPAIFRYQLFSINCLLVKAGEGYFERQSVCVEFNLFPVTEISCRFSPSADFVCLVRGFGKMNPGMSVGNIFGRRVEDAGKGSVFIVEMSRLSVRILESGKQIV